jgi:serine/threonine protein kinase
MSPSSLQPGSRLGKYEIVAHIATGGMGAVYRATDVELRRTVALKVLPAHLAMRPASMERFRREARHAARLNHPNIVTLYECGYDPAQDAHYLAMEFIDGIDLGEHIIRKGKLSPEETRRILFQAAKALEHAFAQGIIHRDIKPSNFLLARSGEKMVVKMTDLGLAIREEDDDNFKVTREGSTVGTIDYISPEQAQDSRAADIRSDIYSLGCTAYQMLAGQPPFAEGGLAERIYKHMQTAPTDIREFSPKVSEGFWGILWKMLAKDPDDRFATPTDLIDALKRTPAEASRKKPAAPSRSGRQPGSKPTVRVTPPPGALASTVDQPHDPTPTPQSGDNVASLITPEQMRAAAAFHERAVQVLVEGGGLDYARQLLSNCMKLDPFNPTYRKTLRDLNKKQAGSGLGRWLGSLNVMGIKSQLRAARTSRDWRKVLELGEDVLARQPADVETHIDLATAAEELDLPNLAMWFLHQARDLVPDNVELLRTMAQMQENRREWKKALVLWQMVQQARPDDKEARHKIKELANS